MKKDAARIDPANETQMVRLAMATLFAHAMIPEIHSDSIASRAVELADAILEKVTAK